MRQHKDGGTQPAPVPSSHGQMKAQIMRPRWTDNCVHVPWITPSLPSPFPNNPAPLPIKSQRFFGTASPPSNCLPELPPLFLLDAVSPSSAMCPQGPCHQPRALMGPDSPRLEVMADQTLLGIRQRAAFFLWKHLWKALWSHSFKYFCPKRLYFLVKTGHFLTCSTEHLGSGNSARSCAELKPLHQVRHRAGLAPDLCTSTTVQTGENTQILTKEENTGSFCKEYCKGSYWVNSSLGAMFMTEL